MNPTPETGIAKNPKQNPLWQRDAAVTPAPRWRYQLDDSLGSSALEIGRDGVVLSREEYRAYGSTSLLIETAGIPAKRYRWSGKERDTETGLYFFGARYFSPALGRWASADPAGLVDGNGFRVVRGNPVGLREVDGREERETVWGSLDPDYQGNITEAKPITLEQMANTPGLPPERQRAVEEIMPRADSIIQTLGQQAVAQEIAENTAIEYGVEIGFEGAGVGFKAARSIGRATRELGARALEKVTDMFTPPGLRRAHTDTLRRNAEVADDWIGQIHHLLPVSVAQKSQALKRLASSADDAARININDKQFLMPMNNAPSPTGDWWHNGSHANYSRHVQDELKKLDDFQGDDRALRQEVDDLVRRLREEMEEFIDSDGRLTQIQTASRWAA